ncbi:MAG: hypothetical protein ACP5F9_05385 [Thiomonas sp.]
MGARVISAASSRAKLQLAQQYAANLRRLMQWLAAGFVRAEITERIGLAEARYALYRRSACQALGKIVMQF